jgi:hypothetical protein
MDCLWPPSEFDPLAFSLPRGAGEWRGEAQIDGRYFSVRSIVPFRGARSSYMRQCRSEEGDMKYALLIHSGDVVLKHFNSLDDVEQKEILDEYSVLTEAPGVEDSARLHPADTATTVRVKDGRTLTTDGTFIEAKEALGGYYIYEGKDLDAAIELAARIPAARMGGAIEIRPVVEG